MPDSLDELSVDTIRTLSMDAAQAASSGHPGTPAMALAPVAYCLRQRVLRFNPENSIWANRDRWFMPRHIFRALRRGTRPDECVNLGRRVIGVALAQELVAAFLKAEFAGEERRARRLNKITALEEKFTR